MSAIIDKILSEKMLYKTKTKKQSVGLLSFLCCATKIDVFSFHTSYLYSFGCF